MSEARQLLIEILGNAKEGQKAFSDISQSIEKFNAQNKSMGQKMTSFGKNLTTHVTLPIIGAFAAAAFEGAKEEQSLSVFNNALQKSTGATQKQTTAMDEWIKKNAEATGVARDKLYPAMTNLVVAGESLTEAQKEVTLAEDIAVTKHQDLAVVTKALGKAYDRSTGALGKLGIQTKDAAGKALSFDQIMQTAAARMGGAVAKNAETAAGKFSIMKVKVQDAVEEFGSNFLPVVSKVADFIGTVASAFGSLPGGVQTSIIVFGLLAAAAGPVMTAIGGAITFVSAFEADLELMQVRLALAQTSMEEFGAVVSVLSGPIGWVIAGVGALIAGFTLFGGSSHKAKVSVDDYSAALQKTGQAQKDALKTTIAHTLGQSKFADSMRSLNLSTSEQAQLTRDASSAIQGHSAAFTANTKSIKDNLEQKLEDNFGDLKKREEIIKQIAALSDLTKVVDKNKDKYKDQAQQQKDTTAATSSLNEATTKHKESLDEMNSSLVSSASDYDKVTQKLNTFYDALNKNIDSQLSFMDTQNSVATGQADLLEKLKASKGALDASTQSTKDGKQAAADAESAMHSQIDTIAKYSAMEAQKQGLQKGSKEAAQIEITNLQTLDKQLTGPSKVAMDGYIQTLQDKIDHTYTTTIKADDQATPKVQTFASMLKGLPTSWGFGITATTKTGSGHALGGAVSSGTAYPVGEKGPEMFMPGTNGTIIPNNQLSMGGGTTIVLAPQVAGSVITERDLGRYLMGVLQTFSKQNGGIQWVS